MIMDDEQAWFGYAKAALAGVVACSKDIRFDGATAVDEVVVKIADKMLERHRARFTQGKFS